MGADGFHPALVEEDDLIRVLTEPKNALIKQYQKLFELDGVRLRFEKDALRGVLFSRLTPSIPGKSGKFRQFAGA